MPLAVGNRLAAPLPLGGARLGAWLLTALLALLALHAAGVCRDFIFSIRYPFALDYGEGIVWQQAALIPGPRAYAGSWKLPFVVFHYPPLYHLVVRAAAAFMPDMLSAGRLVSAVSTALLVPLVANLVLAASPPREGQPRIARFAIAAAAGLLAPCLHAVHAWGSLMRVDMLAVAFGLSALLVAVRTDGRFRGATCALLLAVAAVYCKQTQLAPGATIFLVTLLRRPRAALGAGAIAGLAGLAGVGVLQALTAGGFLRNIIGGNLNRLSPAHAYWVFMSELGSLPFVLFMARAAVAIASPLRRAAVSGWRPMALRLADPASAARAMLLIDFILSTLMLFTVFKSGAEISYLIDWLCIGSVLVGVAACDLFSAPRAFAFATGCMILSVLSLPLRRMPDQAPRATLEAEAKLVREIAAADMPVASDDMTLLMRAGKPVIFEPGIVTELADVGRWDEAPLVAMIRARRFAFMLTIDDRRGDSSLRSPGVDAAMRAGYPRTERIGALDLWRHLPPPAA